MAVQKVEDFLIAVNEEGNKKEMRFEKFNIYILVFSFNMPSSLRCNRLFPNLLHSL